MPLLLPGWVSTAQTADWIEVACAAFMAYTASCFRAAIAAVVAMNNGITLSMRLLGVATDSAVYFLAWQLKNLPVYTLAAKVCPPGARNQQAL